MSLEDMLADLRDEYLNDLPSAIEVIRQCIKNDDIEELQSEFHKLKGSGLTYGIPEISTVCEIVEDLCERNPPKGLLASGYGVQLLTRIHEHYQTQNTYNFTEDSHYLQLKNL